MADLRFAIIGAGFWSRFQIAAWQEAGGVQCVAVCDQAPARAEALAAAFGVPAVYSDAREMLDCETLDFADVITGVETHNLMVHLAAERKLPVICQKPMATTLEEAAAMVNACREAKSPLLIHENWRWQAPIRRLKRELDAGSIGAPFRARISFCSSFPVFDNQPHLKRLEQFILTDIGSHILDVARFLFGEAETLCCQTQRIRRDICGEDVATVMMQMSGSISAATVTCEMSYASRTEHERFPETFIFIEGEKGSVELAPDYWLRVTTEAGTHSKRYALPRYEWADPAYDLVQASMVPCQKNLLRHLRGEAQAETTGKDNLKTMQLVFAAYKSAQSGETVRLIQ